MQGFKTSTGTIHFTVTGLGMPVILLHGFLEDHTMWQPFVPTLTDWGYQVITVDLPCHGKSRFDGERCSMQEMAEGVVDLCQHLALTDPHIIAHSMGGYVGLEILNLYASKLTLLHSNFWADDTAKKKNRNRVIDIVQKNKRLFIQEAIPALFYKANKKKLVKEIDQLKKIALQISETEIVAATKGLRDRVQHYETMNEHEVNLIQGDQDPTIPQEKLNEEVKRLSRMPQVITISQCGHMSFLEQPAQLIKALKTVLFQ